MPALLIGAICVAAVSLVCAAATTNDDRLLPLQLAFPSIFASCRVHGWSRVAALRTAGIGSAAQHRAGVEGCTHAHDRVSCIWLLLCFPESAWNSSQLLAKPEQLGWSRALLFTGVCIKFAAIPFLFWLFRLADELPAVVLGFILAVIDIAAVGELIAARTD